MPTLGGEVELKIPAGSNSGKRMRLRGRGMPGRTPGDQLITLEIHAPPAATEAQRKLYEQMAKEFDVRSARANWRSGSAHGTLLRQPTTCNSPAQRLGRNFSIVLISSASLTGLVT